LSVGPKTSVVDAFCRKLEERLTYEPNERDMVVMHHEIDASFDNGDAERHTSSFLMYGDSNHSAMAKTVGYTVAASANLVVDGHLQGARGLLLPTESKLYLPVLSALEKEDIVFDDIVLALTSSCDSHVG
jgi:alpha-aminoadipic semialdehyde synthase